MCSPPAGAGVLFLLAGGFHVSGAPYHGGYRQSPRVSRHSRVIADGDFDTTPTFAPFVAYPWTTAPTEVGDAGAFGVNADNQLAVCNEVAFIPVAGIRPVLSPAGNLTLLQSDAGSIVRFTAAAGHVITLPTPAPGLFFEFHVDTTITSNAAKIVTKTPASEFLRGWYKQSTDGTYVQAVHAANGTTHVAWSGNGSTTGGIIGDVIYLVGISTTIWQIWGFGAATGTEATPFATS